MKPPSKLMGHFFRMPMIAVAFLTFMVLVTYDGALRALSPTSSMIVGPLDGAGPFEILRTGTNSTTRGPPITGPLHPLDSFGWVGDIHLSQGAAEGALLEYVCGGFVLETRQVHFKPGERANGALLGRMAVPANAAGDCELQRTISVTPWYRITSHMKLNSVHMTIRPNPGP